MEEKILQRQEFLYSSMLFYDFIAYACVHGSHKLKRINEPLFLDKIYFRVNK